MEAVKNMADKVTGKGDQQQAGVTNSAAVGFHLRSARLAMWSRWASGSSG